MENVSDEIKAKGEILLRDGKVKKEMETDRRTYFKVLGETDTHSVFFDKKKNEWECDCAFFALQQKTCSHIIASKMKEQSKL
jgi:hypothetical protein